MMLENIKKCFKRRWVLLNIDMDIFNISKSVLYDRKNNKMYTQSNTNKFEYRLLNTPISKHRSIFLNIVKIMKIGKCKLDLNYSYRKPPQIMIVTHCRNIK